MIWKSSLFVFNRFINVLIVLMFFVAPIVHAGSVPVIVEDDLGGTLGFSIDGERNTCDPAFLEVMNNRAWEEGQREITQNSNIIARPDSVLSMTCFDSFMDNLTKYADNNFPGKPQWANGEMTGSLGSALNFLSGEFTQWFVITPANAAYNFLGRGNGIASPVNISNPLASANDIDGYLMYAVIELLVLDQLVDNVPSDGASDIMRGLDVVVNPKLAACVLLLGTGEFKQYYIENNFPRFLIGDRASIPVNISSTATWTIPSTIRNVADPNGYACNRMNQVWQATKCYDALRESGVFNIIPDHDGFYSLQKYRDDSLIDPDGVGPRVGTDYRTREVMCDIPPVDNSLPPNPRNLAFPSDSNMLCNVAEHGIPKGIVNTTNLVTLISSFNTLYSAIASNPLPTWVTADAVANPLPGAAGGVDPYLHFLGLRDTANCAGITPIKTGYIIMDSSTGNKYVDAVCPAPGCFFNPPTTIAGNGTCQ